MLIRNFKSSYFSQFVLIFIIAFSLWFWSIIHPKIFEGAESIQSVFNLFNTWISYKIWIGPIIGFLALACQALFLNSVLIKNEIVPKNTLVPAFIYILVGSQFPEILMFNPSSIALILLILSLDRIFKCYGNNDPNRELLSASLYISLASLFYFPSISILLLVYIAIVNFSISNWRALIIPLIGTSIPYIYLASYYYIDNQLNTRYLEYISYFNSIRLANISVPDHYYIVWGLLFILVLISFFYFWMHIQEKNIIIRKKMSIIMVFLLFGFLPVIFSGENFLLNLLIFTIPVASLISFFLSNARKIKIFEYLIWVLIVLLIMQNYLIFK